jgi:hypothetical protein
MLPTIDSKESCVSTWLSEGQGSCFDRKDDSNWGVKLFNYL